MGTPFPPRERTPRDLGRVRCRGGRRAARGCEDSPSTSESHRRLAPVRRESSRAPRVSRLRFDRCRSPALARDVDEPFESITSARGHEPRRAGPTRRLPGSARRPRRPRSAPSPPAGLGNGEVTVGGRRRQHPTSPDQRQMAQIRRVRGPDGNRCRQTERPVTPDFAGSSPVAPVAATRGFHGVCTSWESGRRRLTGSLSPASRAPAPAPRQSTARGLSPTRLRMRLRRAAFGSPSASPRSSRPPGCAGCRRARRPPRT